VNKVGYHNAAVDFAFRSFPPFRRYGRDSRFLTAATRRFGMTKSSGLRLGLGSLASQRRPYPNSPPNPLQSRHPVEVVGRSAFKPAYRLSPGLLGEGGSLYTSLIMIGGPSSPRMISVTPGSIIMTVFCRPSPTPGGGI
jgi:hypothetical protein